MADNGSIFLDEIAELDVHLQVKLLRALQEKEIDRIGGASPIPVDVRVIAATNKNIREEIQNKTFREDLYHRLSVIVIEVPPLHQRLDDIPLLVGQFLGDFCTGMGKPLMEIAPEAMEALKEIRWTGNVRELKNVVERLAILCDGTIIADDVKRFAI